MGPIDTWEVTLKTKNSVTTTPKFHGVEVLTLICDWCS